MEKDNKKEKPVYKCCGDCTNFDGVICDLSGLLCFEDDDPKLRCGYKGFKEKNW